MEIIPAIDIKDGQCVRLYQGDYERMTIFDHDPVAVARRWAELGAQRLHVVDLDGAKAGRPVNAQIVFAIVRAVDIPVQLGGGLRDHASVDAALNLGVDRAILGTAAICEPALIHELVQHHGERIVIGVDARHGLVAVNGWQDTAQIKATDLVRRVAEAGVRHVIYTDIIRDGTLRGPNVEALAELVSMGRPDVIASGGVGSIKDLLRLARAGAVGAIVGQALYTGAIDLGAAHEALAQQHLMADAGETTMATNKADVTAKFEEEKLRVQEQSQLIYLQNQIDELRRMIKDQNNKYAWAMEQSRRAEGQIGQFQNLIERQAQEIQTTLEVYKREITALRREIAATMVRAEEAVKPLREIHAQIHQLQEARRQDREAVLPWQNRVEDLEPRIRELLSLIQAGDERYRQFHSQFEQLRIADGALAAEIRQVDEQVQIEKQNLRRQTVEAQQLVADVRASLDDPVARIARLDERIDVIEEHLETLPPSIEALATKIPSLQEDVRRVELMATERFLLTQDRLEDLRHQHDERLVEINEAGDQHLLHLTSWLERVDAWCREHEGRVARIGSRLELLHQRHEARLSDLEEQELDTLERIAGAWKDVLENVKAVHVERRDDELPQER